MEVPEDNNIDVLIEEPLGDINRMYAHTYTRITFQHDEYANKLHHLF